MRGMLTSAANEQLNVEGSRRSTEAIDTSGTQPAGTQFPQQPGGKRRRRRRGRGRGNHPNNGITQTPPNGSAIMPQPTSPSTGLPQMHEQKQESGGQGHEQGGK